MKKILLATVVGLTGLVGASSALAGSDSKSFNVNVTLTSACKLSTVTDVDFGTYTSLQTTTQSATGGAFTVTCTNSLPYSLKFTNISGGATASGTVPTVLLAYTLGLSSAGGSGDGTAQAVNITGSMAANQAGTCSSASCSGTDATQVLYVTY